MVTKEEYYGDASNLGNYQYVTLKEVVDGMLLESSDPDSFIKNVSRTLILLHAKNGISELTADISKDVKGLELEIGSDLQFKLPQNFLNWVRVSLVKDGMLLPLDINNQVNIAPTYLQDHDYELLFDNNGDVIEADGHNAAATPFKRYVFNKDYVNSTEVARFELDTSKISKHGEFSIDRRRGVIFLSSDLEGKNIVLEYITDGLDEDLINNEEITIHKFLKEPLRRWIYWNIIDTRRNVDKMEKRKAQKAYNGAKTVAMNRLSDFRVQDVLKAIRSRGVWVKT